MFGVLTCRGISGYRPKARSRGGKKVGRFPGLTTEGVRAARIVIGKTRKTQGKTRKTLRGQEALKGQSSWQLDHKKECETGKRGGANQLRRKKRAECWTDILFLAKAVKGSRERYMKTLEWGGNGVMGSKTGMPGVRKEKRGKQWEGFEMGGARYD